MLHQAGSSFSDSSTAARNLCTFQASNCQKLNVRRHDACCGDTCTHAHYDSLSVTHAHQKPRGVCTMLDISRLLLQYPAEGSHRPVTRSSSCTAWHARCSTACKPRLAQSGMCLSGGSRAFTAGQLQVTSATGLDARMAQEIIECLHQI